jgi:Zinc knuckle
VQRTSVGAAIQHQGMATRVCHHCKQPGHIRPQCPLLHANANCVQHKGIFCIVKEAWLIDCGSTDHVSPCNEGMTDYVAYEKPEFLVVGNGHKEAFVVRALSLSSLSVVCL